MKMVVIGKLHSSKLLHPFLVEDTEDAQGVANSQRQDWSTDFMQETNRQTLIHRHVETFISVQSWVSKEAAS